MAVAASTSPDGGRDVAAQEERARELARAWRKLESEDSGRAAELVREVRRFARMLRFLGVADPFELEAPAPFRFRSLVPFVLPLVALAPFALLGWIPYRLTGILAVRLTRDTDVIGTLKGLIGLALVPAWFLAEALAVGLLVAPHAGVAVFVVAPLTGFLAIRRESGWRCGARC